MHLPHLHTITPRNHPNPHPERNTLKTLIHGGGPTHFGYITSQANRTPTRLEIYPPTTGRPTRILLNAHRQLTLNNPALASIYLTLGVISFLAAGMSLPIYADILIGFGAAILLPVIGVLAGALTHKIHPETLLIVPTPGSKTQPLPASMDAFLDRILSLDEDRYGAAKTEDAVVWAMETMRLPVTVQERLLARISDEARPAESREGHHAH
jgi:hypothetical protein